MGGNHTYSKVPFDASVQNIHPMGAGAQPHRPLSVVLGHSCLPNPSQGPRGRPFNAHCDHHARILIGHTPIARPFNQLCDQPAKQTPIHRKSSPKTTHNKGHNLASAPITPRATHPRSAQLINRTTRNCQFSETKQKHQAFHIQRGSNAWNHTEKKGGRNEAYKQRSR